MTAPSDYHTIIRRLARDLVEMARNNAVESERQRQRITELERQVEQERATTAELQGDLKAVYASETWKAGAVVLWLPKKLRDLRRAR